MGDRAKRQLMFHGVLLFFFGLLTGSLLAFAPGQIANPRGVLAGHLEGVMNGTFLFALAYASQHIRLSERAGKVMLALLLYGSYANWAATTLAGIVGTSEGTPIAGAGHVAGPFAETGRSPAAEGREPLRADHRRNQVFTCARSSPNQVS